MKSSHIKITFICLFFLFLSPWRDAHSSQYNIRTIGRQKNIPGAVNDLLSFNIDKSRLPSTVKVNDNTLSAMSGYTAVLINTLYRRRELNEVSQKNLIGICYYLTAVYRSLSVKELTYDKRRKQLRTAVKQIVMELNTRFKIGKLDMTGTPAAANTGDTGGNEPESPQDLSAQTGGIVGAPRRGVRPFKSEGDQPQTGTDTGGVIEKKQRTRAFKSDEDAQKQRAAIKIQRVFRKSQSRKKFVTLVTGITDVIRHTKKNYTATIDTLDKQNKALKDDLMRGERQSQEDQKKIEELTAKLATLAEQKTSTASVQAVPVQMALVAKTAVQWARAKRTVRQLEQAMSDVRAELSSAREQIHQAADQDDQESRRQKRQVEEQEVQLKELRALVQEKTKEAEELKQLNQDLQADLKQKEQNVIEVNKQIEEFNNDLEGERQRIIKAATKMVEEAQTQQATSGRDHARRMEEIEQAKQQLEDELGRLKEASKTSNRTIGELTKARDSFEHQLRELQTESEQALARSDAKANQMKRGTSKAQKELETAQEDFADQLSQATATSDRRAEDLQTHIADLQGIMNRFIGEIQQGDDTDQTAHIQAMRDAFQAMEAKLK